MFGHKAGCSMKRRNANENFDSAERRLLLLNQADYKLQKDGTSQIKTDNVYLRQNGTIDTFSPMLFERPMNCGILLQETCSKCAERERISSNTGGSTLLLFERHRKIETKEIVLDTINQLQKSKARSGFERICHRLCQRHDLSKADVQEELNPLVDSEAVIKRDQNGNTSYRGAAK
ncbi:hypothetical protein HPB51_012320 [Rhipicephalus microplus]|uniref:SAMD1-like winged helix (WH) domain-containing protein n=1 Tax=Rhipicephalus microplus TaxID=6941 RepID=A0A9J6D9V5_RHIMP|nr:hypothetical protein HPB51_012320 [Rhipicephalus microplus]